MPFQLPDLKFPTNALEPHIDKETMTIHHDKHHAGYVKKLNTALENTDFADNPIDDILKNIEQIPEDLRKAVINNGGGHANHSLFWELLTNESTTPSEELKEAINKKFESLENFKEQFANEATTRFGSGWAWLIINKTGELEIRSTPNQDSPLMDNQTPILALDVWEHAYYLKYQNKRPDYIEAFWNVLNWNKVSELFKEATN
tara:strand:+ start:533 stop:1141 length:609 start_codon:yes stop_codon:yes gene_type:complete